MITVITGPPCSGKTTYARQHAMPGDLIVDFDAIAQALGSPVSHGHDEHYAETAAAAWSAAIREALTRCQGRHNAWIIDSKPSTYRLQEYARASARYVHAIASREELHHRADADGRPKQWHARIDEFLASTDPEPARTTRW